ncbi:MAG TPA: hypothetical protein VFB72_06735, partial [Verrucomicrobiae bacterium]|nr:hypothetical protein [Verrucomicrobiae bacterium]
VPALRRLWQLPRAAISQSGSAPAAATAAILLGGLIWLSCGQAALARTKQPILVESPIAESVTQQIRLEDKFAIATEKIHWQAEKGQALPVLFEPAVLTRIIYPTRALKLEETVIGGRRAQELIAHEHGVFDIEVQYELQVSKSSDGSSFILPTQNGLINQVNLTLSNLDVDVTSPQAVSIQRETRGSNTVATLVLSPLSQTQIGWHPRTRDVKREKPVFYAEFYQLYVPSAGVIEGAHYVALRPAQGELSELTFDVPKGATVTDVMDPNPSGSTPLVSLWRFDPDTRKLRVNLNPPQSRPFALVIRSQVATGPLPLEQSVGLVSVENAAGQIGQLGIATGNEVQLDDVTANGFSPINLEDFPAGVGQLLQAQFPGFTVHRAFRYADSKAVAAIKASAVEPDVRVESQDTLSLGEDRTVLAANLTVDITRAGIFKLSFLLPAGMDVESVSGDSLSHWTESKTDAGRVITMHLRGKTEGQQQFALSLSGPGVKATNGWTAPGIVLHEASKQRGTLLIVPEQGMRLQVARRDGLTQLDPQKSGIRQKGVLAFRVLQAPWNLSLDIEQVEPWIQVTSLQHALISEAQMKVTANLQYQIENTGLKSFHILLPTNAANVNFQGEQIADFMPNEGTVSNGLQYWEVKLQRRIIGQYMLQASYQIVMPELASEATLRGVQAADVNLQRGFLTIQSGGRLQVRPPDSVPAILQPAEWQSIPRVLQQNLTTSSANFAYRLVDPAFELALKLERREAAKLLRARINDITFTSVISDDGIMLTHALLNMQPGDMRLLSVTMPQNGKFWFAFANQNGVWPWTDTQTNTLLIPLEQPSRVGQTIPVEFFYTTRVGGGHGAGDLQLPAPKFDLPLENITWRVFLDEKWQVKHWGGSFQLEEQQVIPCAVAMDGQLYLEKEAVAQREKTKQAEEMLALGNTMLQNGDPQQARRAFQSAYGLSQGDDAFNEDSRVQLNNLKLQQALIGLNLRQATTAGETAALGSRWRDLREHKQIAYTQQDAKDIIERNSADENAAFMRLAERLIQQQDAAVSSPAAIRANVPEEGRLLTFKRAVSVDPSTDLRINLETVATQAAPWGARLLVLALTLLICGAFAWAGQSFRRSSSSPAPA